MLFNFKINYVNFEIEIEHKKRSTMLKRKKMNKKEKKTVFFLHRL
jgi:hypothetical protein